MTDAALRRIFGDAFGHFNPESQGKYITILRSAMKHGCRELGVPPPDLSGLRPPSRKAMRLAKASTFGEVYTARHARAILERVKPNKMLYASCLLGLNAGLAPNEIATLRAENVDRRTGWVEQ